MSTPRKYCEKYFFSVEGETEAIYLRWLQQVINATQNASCKVHFDVKIENPIGRVKGLQSVYKTVIYHLCDYESSNEEHQKKFLHQCDDMREAERLGKAIEYKLGYCNFSFELWILLHAIDAKKSLSNRTQYLAEINRAYDENFKSLDEFKNRKNLERFLQKLSLQNVIDAVRRAEAITKNNEMNGFCLMKYKRCTYYRENPSLSLGSIFGVILRTCRLV